MGGPAHSGRVSEANKKHLPNRSHLRRARALSETWAVREGVSCAFRTHPK